MNETVDQQTPQEASEMDRYFARMQGDKLGPALMEKVTGYYEYLRTTGKLQLYQHVNNLFYRGEHRGGKLKEIGKQNEFLSASVNHFQNICLNIINRTTEQKPAYQPRAANTDHKSLAQCIMAEGILDHYNREVHMDEHGKKATSNGVLYSEGHILRLWDKNQGDDHMVNPDDGTVIKKGDVAFSTHTPIDVIRDWTRMSGFGHEWNIVRDFENKYNLAAKYKQFSSQILALNCDFKSDDFTVRFGSTTGMDETDLIPRFRLIHKRTPAVPKGRYVEFLSADTVLVDGELPYKRLPISRLAPLEKEGEAFGYTTAFDLAVIQLAIDALWTIILTNQKNYGVGNIWMPGGMEITIKQIADGLNYITAPKDPAGGKPEVLDLLKTPKEIFETITMLEQAMETIAGLNSTARGNPEASLKSGAALAMMASQAIQFNSGLQQSYAAMHEDLSTGLIETIQAFANTPRVALMVGKQKRSYLKSFQGSDIADVVRVSVDLGNPLSRTVSGRIQMAESFLEKKMVTTPEQYIQVVSTGTLDSMIEGTQAELMLIRAENEAMSEGKPVKAIATDQHSIHVKEHKAVLASPEARLNPQLAQSVLGHIQEHINLLRVTDPAVLALCGETPVAPVMPSAPPPGAPGGGGADGGAAAVTDPRKPVEKKADSVALPNMPKNPQTGEPLDMPAGAAA
jgi:hypothetical protein